MNVLLLANGLIHLELAFFISNFAVTTAVNYAQALHNSILFYEAQRSGPLPPDQRVSWRRDSALGDRGDGGEDLTGGWYDAGDYVKFGLPGAGAATNLAWGVVEFREAYIASGELENVLASIKWQLDYFLKCIVSDTKFYAQVGNGDLDHAFWGRPEDMTMPRPAYSVTSSAPGSDVAGETAAALAAGSIIFAQTDGSYSRTLLAAARRLFNFADTYRGYYSDSIPDADNFYKSRGYLDELVWSACWLYRATGESGYLNKARAIYSGANLHWSAWAFDWDTKQVGAQVLLYQLSGEDGRLYQAPIEGFIDNWSRNGGGSSPLPYTPKGLAFRSQWGSLRYSANAALVALVAAKYGIRTSQGRQFARSQIDYMLGESGQTDISFQIGYGRVYPKQPHHASSSCPPAPATCDWSDFNKPGDNFHQLTGALVGGPGSNDEYEDRRSDYVKNEVTLDYNAGFQSALAGLMDLDL